MKRKQMRKAMAILLSASITMTSVSWNQLLSAKASGIGEREEIEPEEAMAEHAIEEEKAADATVFDLGGNRKMEVYYGSDVRFRNEEGELVDYDPSLVPVSDAESIGGTGLEGYAYKNKEGDSKQYLPEELSGETPVVMEKEGYRISFHPVVEPCPQVQVGEGKVRATGKETGASGEMPGKPMGKTCREK